MEIDLNRYHVEAIIKNNRMQEVSVKLPKTEESLEHSLLQKRIAEENVLGYKSFDKKLKSVLSLKQIDNINIEPPMNIYYLNLYLNLLKEKNIKLDTKKDTWNTEIIQTRIAELLDCESMNYEGFLSYMKDGRNKEQKDNSKPDKPKEKPLFSIDKLQKRHIERKWANE